MSINTPPQNTHSSARLADYVYIGSTQSLCPDCLAVVPAKIITRGKRVFFRKRCSKCGEREDFVCSDVRYYDRMEYAVPGKVPLRHGIEPDKGCPYDCGLCTEHEQHTCIALVEVNSNCNLKCPMCFASSGPGGQNLTYDQCVQSIDRIVSLEGRAEVVQLSGGEPTIHPQFREIVDYAIRQPIDYVQINTNGIRLANDQELLQHLAQYSDRLEVFMQFDGLDPEATIELRGEDLLATKLRAIENLGANNIHITLAVTLQPGVNDHQLGPIVQFAIERPWITGINFQPATYSGRHVLPSELENRITFPDVIEGICQQTDGLFEPSDFLPLPCAHPNCHIIGLSYRHAPDEITPINRMFDVTKNLDLLANGITFTRERSKQLIDDLMARISCSTDCEIPDHVAVENGFARANDADIRPVSEELRKRATQFLTAAVADELGAQDLLRITITSFLDVYNFDLRRLMKCCTHHVLPSGHVIPFCAYNVLYREGHAALPDLVTDLDTRDQSSS